MKQFVKENIPLNSDNQRYTNKNFDERDIKSHSEAGAFKTETMSFRFEKLNKQDVFKFVRIHEKLVIFSLVTLVISSTIGLALSRDLIHLFITKAPSVIYFSQTTPEEIFILALKTAILLSFIFSFPVISIYWLKLESKNIDPGKRKLFCKLLAINFILFLSGILFSYFKLIPFSTFLLMGFSGNIAHFVFDISNYISFCVQIMLIATIIFEIPLIIYILSKTDLVDYKKLSKNRKSIIIGILIFSFILMFSSEILKLIIFGGIIIFLCELIVFTVKILKN